MTDGIATPPAAPYCHKERIDIDDNVTFDDQTIRRHIIRYEWAQRKIAERFGRAGAVIDCACGTGYGSKMLLNVAYNVLGVDVAQDAIDLATKKHGGTLLDFVNYDMSERPMYEGQFDAAVCIETIEHVKEDATFLKHLRECIYKNGLLVLSTPLRASGTITDKPANPFHVREYDHADLCALVRAAGFDDLVIDTGMTPGFIFLTARAA